MAVGVGKAINKPALRTITMNNDGHIFTVQEYKLLETILDRLSEQSCPQGKCIIKTIKLNQLQLTVAIYPLFSNQIWTTKI